MAYFGREYSQKTKGKKKKRGKRKMNITLVVFCKSIIFLFSYFLLYPALNSTAYVPHRQTVQVTCQVRILIKETTSETFAEQQSQLYPFFWVWVWSNTKGKRPNSYKLPKWTGIPTYAFNSGLNFRIK